MKVIVVYPVMKSNHQQIQGRDLGGGPLPLIFRPN